MSCAKRLFITIETVKTAGDMLVVVRIKDELMLLVDAQTVLYVEMVVCEVSA